MIVLFAVRNFRFLKIKVWEVFQIAYYNYHSTAKKLISDGKLISWYFTKKHNAISPALVLLFDDVSHPKMPIRDYRWDEYLPILPKDKEMKDPTL